MWHDGDIRDLDLKEALEDIAPGSQIVFSTWMVGIQVNSAAPRWARADLDLLLRFVLWALLPVMAASAYWGYHHPFLPLWGGMWLLVGIVGALGCACSDNITSAFRSRIHERLRQAKEADLKEDMIAELFLLTWAIMHTSTPFSMITRPWVLWGNTDNNFWLSAVLKLREAMKLLKRMPCTSKTKWSDRDTFRKYLDGVEKNIDEMQRVADWTIWFPRGIMSFMAYTGFVLAVFSVLSRVLLTQF